MPGIEFVNEKKASRLHFVKSAKNFSEEEINIKSSLG
jgi:hypothetical protein